MCSVARFRKRRKEKEEKHERFYLLNAAFCSLRSCFQLIFRSGIISSRVLARGAETTTAVVAPRHFDVRNKRRGRGQSDASYSGTFREANAT